MKTGTVKWFNPQKGYGYIKPVDGGFDVYVNSSAVERAGMLGLKEGQKINFEIAVDPRTGETFAVTLQVPAGGPEEAGSIGGLGGPLGLFSFAKFRARQRTAATR